MSPTRGHVQIDRTFRTLSTRVDADAYDAERLPTFGARLTWPELLQLPRVVMLSEAGAGKTAEVREQARRLRQDGKAAFFVRLEHVATEFESAFEEGDFEGFQAWLKGAGEGWLLLDSVDEARLRSPQDFEAAVRKVAHKLRPAIVRAHVIITSRPYAWRARTDLALCELLLPSAPERALAAEVDVSGERGSRDRPDGPFTVVALDDLSMTQVEAFAAARGVADVKEFRDAVVRAEAQSFTARPLDLERVMDLG